MKRLIIIVLLVTLISINLLGCNSSERTELRGQNAQNLRREKQKGVGMPDPSADSRGFLGPVTQANQRTGPRKKHPETAPFS